MGSWFRLKGVVRGSGEFYFLCCFGVVAEDGRSEAARSSLSRPPLTSSRNAAMAGEIHLSLCQSTWVAMSSDGPDQCSATNWF